MYNIFFYTTTYDNIFIRCNKIVKIFIFILTKKSTADIFRNLISRFRFWKMTQLLVQHPFELKLKKNIDTWDDTNNAPICINTIVKVIFRIIWPLKMVSVILQEWAFNQTSTCIPIKSFEMPNRPLNFTYEWNCLIIFNNGFWIQKGRNNLIKGVYYAFMMRILFKIISYELFNKDRCPYFYNHVTKLRVWLWKHLWDILYLFLRIDVINSHFHK